MPVDERGADAERLRGVSDGEVFRAPERVIVQAGPRSP